MSLVERRHRPLRARKSALFLKSVVNQRSMQVTAAVAMMLRADNRAAFDQTATMGAGYHYTVTSMGNFMRGVANLLEEGRPAHQFSYDEAFVRKALGMTLNKLASEIEKRTQ